MLEELGIGFVAFSPMANDFLSGRCEDAKFQADTEYRNVMPQFMPEAVEQNQALLRVAATRHQATPTQICLAWILCKKAYIVSIPGTRKLSRLPENAGAAEVLFPTEEAAALDEALDGMELSRVFGGSPVIQQ